MLYAFVGSEAYSLGVILAGLTSLDLFEKTLFFPSVLIEGAGLIHDHPNGFYLNLKPVNCRLQ